MNSLYSNNQVTKKEVNPRTTPWLAVSGKTKKQTNKPLQYVFSVGMMSKLCKVPKLIYNGQ